MRGSTILGAREDPQASGRGRKRAPQCDSDEAPLERRERGESAGYDKTYRVYWLLMGSGSREKMSQPIFQRGGAGEMCFPRINAVADKKCPNLFFREGARERCAFPASTR